MFGLNFGFSVWDALSLLLSTSGIFLLAKWVCVKFGGYVRRSGPRLLSLWIIKEEEENFHRDSGVGTLFLRIELLRILPWEYSSVGFSLRVHNLPFSLSLSESSGRFPLSPPGTSLYFLTSLLWRFILGIEELSLPLALSSAETFRQVTSHVSSIELQAPFSDSGRWDSLAYLAYQTRILLLSGSMPTLPRNSVASCFAADVASPYWVV